MKKYAVFLSLTDNYAYLFNALLNSIEFYGVGEYADVVVIHDASISHEYTSYMLEKAKSMAVDIRFIPIVTLPKDKDLGKVLTVKYYRYKIMAEEGVNYESICFIDTDIFLVSGILDYFKIAANTDLIIGVNDNVTRHYKKDVNQGTCPAWADGKKPFFENELWDGKFICNTPMFIDPTKYGGLLMDVFEHRKKIGMDNTWPFTGDLETMNLVFNKNGVKDTMLVLASHLWTNVHYSIYRTSLMSRHISVGDHVDLSSPTSLRKKAIFLSETHDIIRAFHGRNWTSEKNEKHLKGHNIPKLLGQMEGEYPDSSRKKRETVFDTVQAFFLFLQFNCYVTLDDIAEFVPVKEMKYLKKRVDDLNHTIKRFGKP